MSEPMTEKRVRWLRKSANNFENANPGCGDCQFLARALGETVSEIDRLTVENVRLAAIEREHRATVAAVDRHVSERVARVKNWHTGQYVYYDPMTKEYYPTRAEAEAAYRQKAFPGLDVDTKGTSHE